MISQLMPGNTSERSQAALKEEYVTEYSLKQAIGDQDVAGQTLEINISKSAHMVVRVAPAKKDGCRLAWNFVCKVARSSYP